jgi:hypothetical protein
MQWRAAYPGLTQNGAAASNESRGIWTQALISMAVSWASGILVPMSRVVLGYHSVEQVLAGSLVGVLSGLAWFSLLVCPTVQELFETLEKHPDVGFLLQPRKGAWHAHCKTE